MMKKTSVRPNILGEHKRPVTELVDLRELARYNTVFGSYGIAEGEEIIFPPRLEQMRVFIQDSSSDFPDEKMIHVIIERNGKSSYISLGALHLSDMGGMGYACHFSRLLDKFQNDYERLKFLVGKTIKSIGNKDIVFILKERYRINPLFFTPEFKKPPRGMMSTRAPIIEIVRYSFKPDSEQESERLNFSQVNLDKDNKEECNHLEMNYSQSELDDMYRSAYEGDPEAEWNTD